MTEVALLWFALVLLLGVGGPLVLYALIESETDGLPTMDREAAERLARRDAGERPRRDVRGEDAPRDARGEDARDANRRTDRGSVDANRRDSRG